MKTAVYVLVVTALAGASAFSIHLRQDPETLCAGQENFLRISSVDSCFEYYQCYEGRSYLMQCPEEAWFNEQDQICDFVDVPARCQTNEPTTEPQPNPEEDKEEEDNAATEVPEENPGAGVPEENPSAEVPEDNNQPENNIVDETQKHNNHHHHHNHNNNNNTTDNNINIDDVEGSGDEGSSQQASDESIVNHIRTFRLMKQEEFEEEIVSELEEEDFIKLVKNFRQEDDGKVTTETLEVMKQQDSNSNCSEEQVHADPENHLEVKSKTKDQGRQEKLESRQEGDDNEGITKAQPDKGLGKSK